MLGGAPTRVLPEGQNQSVTVPYPSIPPSPLRPVTITCWSLIPGEALGKAAQNRMVEATSGDLAVPSCNRTAQCPLHLLLLLLENLLDSFESGKNIETAQVFGQSLFCQAPYSSP